MRILSNPDNDPLKTLPDTQKAYNLDFITAQIKNLFPAVNSDLYAKQQDSLPTSIVLNQHRNYQEDENFNSEGILALSKKIQKLNASRSSNVLIKAKSERKVQKEATIKPQKIFAEETVRTTSDYVKVHFIKKHTLSLASDDENIQDFICFNDNDLKIPKQLSQKTVVNAFDNDVQTDDEQINVAIKDMYESLQEKVEEEKKIMAQFTKALQFFNQI